MIACSLPAWKGAGAVLEGLLTPVGNDGRVWAPEKRGALSASKQSEFNVFVLVYCACLCNSLAIANLTSFINFSSVRLNWKCMC